MLAKAEDRPRDFPAKVMTVALAVMLGCLMLSGAVGTAVILRVLIARQTLLGPWGWQVPTFLVIDLLVVVAAIWGLWRLKPWQGWTGPREPVSPATQKANRLFGLKELLGLAAVLALVCGARDPIKAFSNSPLSPGVAIFAIAAWLLARALREWWGRRSDEHEQRAIDFGRRVGAGLFLAVTPAWWVAARGGLLPQPNVMILWAVTMLATSFGWSWYRGR